MRIHRSDKEIYDAMNTAVEWEERGVTVNGTYAQGVLAAIRWLTEADEPDPLTEEKAEE